MQKACIHMSMLRMEDEAEFYGMPFWHHVKLAVLGLA